MCFIYIIIERRIHIMVKRLAIKTYIMRVRRVVITNILEFDLHMEIERVNHREVRKGTQKTH